MQYYDRRAFIRLATEINEEINSKLVQTWHNLLQKHSKCVKYVAKTLGNLTTLCNTQLSIAGCSIFEALSEGAFS